MIEYTKKITAIPEMGFPRNAKLICTAAAAGDVKTLIELLETGIPPDAWPRGGEKRALSEAIMIGSLECVKALLAAGANPNATVLFSSWRDDYTALSYASGNRALEDEVIEKIIDELVLAGAYVDGVIGLATPIASARSGGNDAAVRALLKHGAKADAPDYRTA